jgi:hypothetical protein
LISLIYKKITNDKVISNKIDDIISKSFNKIIHQKNFNKSKDNIYKLYHEYDMDKNEKKIIIDDIYNLLKHSDRINAFFVHIMDMANSNNKRKMLMNKYISDDLIPQKIYDLLQKKKKKKCKLT